MISGKKVAALFVFACSFFAATHQTKATIEDDEVSVTCAKANQVCYRVVKFGITKNFDGLAQIRL